MKNSILIVEDDPDILFTLTTILTHSGYDVSQLTSGKSIMEDICALPDLYLLDKRMPDFDGLDICRHIRQTEAGNDIPIIIISASPKFGPQALKAGANDFLEKPFTLDKLLTLIKRHLNNHS